MSQNQITFLPVIDSAKNTTILYYSATNDKWQGIIEEKYTSQFRVASLKLEEEDNRKLCGDNCHFYNTRFEADNLIWLFHFIGYLAVIDCIVNLFYHLVVIQQFNKMFDEVHVTSGITSEERELDHSSQTPNKSQPKDASNASLVSQNNGIEAAHEEQAGFEINDVNAEIQEIFTDIKVKKLVKKEGAAKKEVVAKKQ